MKKRVNARLATTLMTSMLIAVLAGAAFAEQKDEKGCKDHPMFTRMPTYGIRGCTQKEFDSYAFKVGDGKTEQVEGRLFVMQYYPQATAVTKPSELQIQRNFENAVLQGFLH